MAKVIDRKKFSEPGEYGIGFASRAMKDDYEHAFVIWYYTDAKGKRTVRRGAGFYPAGTTGKAYDLILGASGKVIDDSKEKIARELIVLVNHGDFDRALAVESKYLDGKTFRLAFSDCTSFVQAVAETVPGLVVPNRLQFLFPTNFIARMYDINLN